MCLFIIMVGMSIQEGNDWFNGSHYDGAISLSPRIAMLGVESKETILE